MWLVSKGNGSFYLIEAIIMSSTSYMVKRLHGTYMKIFNNLDLFMSIVIFQYSTCDCFYKLITFRIDYKSNKTQKFGVLECFNKENFYIMYQGPIDD